MVDTAAFQSLLQEVRARLLATPDTVCLQRARLVTEAYRDHAQKPPPLRRAHAFAHVLRHMDLDLESNPFFAGNTSTRPRAWMLVPEHGMTLNDAQIVVEHECLRDFLVGKIPDDLQAFWRERAFGGLGGTGHLAVDLERVVHQGLAAILAETRSYADDPDPERRLYREAMAIGLQAVIDWAGRYAEAAADAAERAIDPVRRAAHARVAAACRQVPAQPARNLFEGLQAIALVHLAIAIEGHGMSISVGLPDRVLAPWAPSPAETADATVLIAAFMLKLTANSALGRASKTQTITVGGLDHHGRDRCNSLTAAFLDACRQARVGDPPVFLRWHADLDPAIRNQAAALLASGASMPLLVHDVPTVQGFLGLGAPPATAWSYCVIGCNELGIPGYAAQTATACHGTVQYLGFLNQALLEHPDPASLRDMADILACLEATMRRGLRTARERGETHRQRSATIVPTPFTSALMRGTIARGKDLVTGMELHVPALYERGLTNAANALAAIDQRVFTERSMTLPQLLDALRDNLADAALRQRLLAAPKWGNDDDRADRWALALVALRERVLDDLDAEFGHPPHVVCHVVRSLHHTDGRRLGASADGRRAGTPVADSIGAHPGTAGQGPTALLRSVLKLDPPRQYRGGYNLNVTLSPGRTTAAMVQSLVTAFFGQGGQELQINCLDPAQLREARQCPEKHGDLVVRVAGLSARFVDLSTVEQDELMARAEAAAGQT